MCSIRVLKIFCYELLIALSLVGKECISTVSTKCPKYSTDDCRKTHFSGFKRSPLSFRCLKTSGNRCRCSLSVLPVTKMSSNIANCVFYSLKNFIHGPLEDGWC